MDAGARILRCRLLEKMAEQPEYAGKLGLRGGLEKKRGGPLPQKAKETPEEGADGEKGRSA